MSSHELPSWSSVLVVVAHPDDESFGLGAVIDAFVSSGAAVSVLCLTRGEASTLHGVDGDLAEIRGHELAEAAAALGVDDVQLLDFPDGALDSVGLATLADCVADSARRVSARGLLVFDTTGITGHPDHIRATGAAVSAAPELGLDVLAWTVPADVADGLRAEFGADFRGRAAHDVDIELRVDRTRQNLAVTCHPSQAVPSSALWRRLELQGDREHLRWLAR